MEAAPNREHIRNMAEARAHVKRDGGCYIRPIFWPLPRPTTVHGIRHKGRLRKRAHSPRRGQGWSACVAVSHQRQFRRRSADAVGFVQSAQPASTAVKNAGIVVVVPDVLDGIVSVCDAAGLKGRSKLICTIGLLLLIVPR